MRARIIHFALEAFIFAYLNEIFQHCEPPEMKFYYPLLYCDAGRNVRDKKRKAVERDINITKQKQKWWYTEYIVMCVCPTTSGTEAVQGCSELPHSIEERKT